MFIGNCGTMYYISDGKKTIQIDLPTYKALVDLNGTGWTNEGMLAKIEEFRRDEEMVKCPFCDGEVQSEMSDFLQQQLPINEALDLHAHLIH